ncbi:23S rRNA (adenine(2503)-C(2))-methyltransferase RlmN [Candidatus Lokiarchaeum ossiferum]|uniref:23S rRNA (adenine(2503)-C(2))-methyltransferase RlmN n=1 Tax=Candidatus Lokiarchaeum ossiferum TaxID=2951803 RepID=UPI00352F6833
MKENILSFTSEELKSVFKQKYNQPSYRAVQVFGWLYKDISSFDEMQNVPKKLRENLTRDFFNGQMGIFQSHRSHDGTEKFLLKCQDDNIIEAVKMEYHHGTSVCISTQVGCEMGCIFCASGREGLVRNLSAGEMIGQILAIQKHAKKRISNIVLMGAGEPLQNFKEVQKFLELVHDPKGLNVGYRHITLSTCGLVPEIYNLAELNLPITLAISLHSPSDIERSRIMPINRKYPLKDLIYACLAYTKKTKRRITFEYALIKGKNDTIADAEALIKLIKPVSGHVNLIPINTTDTKLQAPDLQWVQNFNEFLNSHGQNATIRRNMGSDINAACGQLRWQYLKKSE